MNSKPQEKQQKWNNKLKELSTIVNNQGIPIDRDILETIAALNLNGFPTIVSCAGHTECHPLTFPFVLGWALNKPENRFTGDKKLRQQLVHGKHHEELELNPEAAEQYYEIVAKNKLCETQEFAAWNKKNALLRKSLQQLLRQFYSKRTASPETKIYLAKETLGYMILTGKIETKEKIRNNDLVPDEEAKIKDDIIAGQKEMKAFTEFLIERFRAQ